jgi:hypothetical protein
MTHQNSPHKRNLRGDYPIFQALGANDLSFAYQKSAITSQNTLKKPAML